MQTPSDASPARSGCGGIRRDWLEISEDEVGTKRNKEHVGCAVKDVRGEAAGDVGSGPCAEQDDREKRK